MAIDSDSGPRLRERLAPYARTLLERCSDYALQIHADEVGPEHLLSTLMDDADCAAHRVVLHAFADPETISGEARALSAGILISGSSTSLPFSAHGVKALRRARSLAAERRDGAVHSAHVLRAAFDELDEDLRATFEDAGWSPSGVEALLGPGGTGSIHESGHLFHSFSDDAKRLLSSAAKLARSSSTPSISAAHLFQACLQAETRLERAAGVPASRARLALRGRSADLERVEGGPLPLDDVLEVFLASVAPGADSLALLRQFHTPSTPELAQVLVRHKVTAPLLDRARPAFGDPD